MCADCRRRLAGNVWRILDCKNAECQDAIAAAPAMVDLLGPESRAYFTAVCAGLDALGVPYDVAPRLVRGLDYYEHTVFEVVHGGLGAQNALAGGGRYALYLPGIEKPVKGVGFAAGLERLLMARQSLGFAATPGPAADVYLASLGPRALAAALSLAQPLRRAGWRVLAELGERSLKAQMRAANRDGVRLVLIRGDSEMDRGSVVVKDMAASTQEEVAVAEVETAVRRRLAAEPSAGSAEGATLYQPGASVASPQEISTRS